MNKTTYDIKEGIKLHCINTDLYKTDFSTLILTLPLKKEMVTKNALIPFLLMRGTAKYPSQYLITEQLENMYGASFNCGIDKIGDNVILKFCMESINNDYIIDKTEDLLKESIELLLDIVFDPLKNDNLLNKDFLDVEKNNLKNVIESKIDNKDVYAFDKCITAMYGEDNYGLYKYGYVEDIEKINIVNITEYYEQLIKNAKIDIFVSTSSNDNYVKEIVQNNTNIKKLNSRKENICVSSVLPFPTEINDIKKVEEKMNVTQGKLVIGIDTYKERNNFCAIALVYNAILGDGANSMIFQNVREKAGLAYSAKSQFIKSKNNIFIRCGIQIDNYDKALSLIEVQLENIKKGEFSPEDIENAKTYLISGIKKTEEEQDTEIVYYIGQELSKTNISIEEYISNIAKVSKEDVVDFANNIKINTIYFLRN